MELIEELEKFVANIQINSLDEHSDLTIIGLRIYQAIKVLFKTKKDYSGKQIRLLVFDGKIKINHSVIFDDSYRIQQGDLIECENEVYRVKNPDYWDEFNRLLIKNLNVDQFRNHINNLFDDYLTHDQINLVIASAIRLEILLQNNEENNTYRYKLRKFIELHLKDVCIKNNIDDNADFYLKIQTIKNIILENYNYLKDLINGLISVQQIKIFQDKYRKHINRVEFKVFFKPFIPVQFLKDDLDIIFGYFNDFSKAQDQNEKNKILKKALDDINKFRELLAQYDLEYIREFIAPLYEKLLSLFNKEIFGDSNATTTFKIVNVGKRYPFFRSGEIDLQINVINDGQGFASNVSLIINSNDLLINKNEYNLGDFLPGERIYSIKTEVTNTNIIPRPVINVLISWKNLNSSVDNVSFKLTFESQDQNVPWDKLKSKKPYSLKAIDNKDKLLGRDNILDEFIENFQSDEIDSYILFGQRRVGKTSIVKSLKAWFDNLQNSNIAFIYLDCTNLRSSNAIESLSKLGTEICQQLLRKIEPKCLNNIIYTGIKNIQIPEFNSTLAPLKSFIEDIGTLLPNIKFIIGIDEFDELQFDLYKPGELSETLFRNLRGLNNNFSNLGFILVGSEKMPKIYNWHGEQLNNWKNRSVDTFDRETQFEEFKKLVEIPTNGFIKYSEEAVNEIFEFSAGNPYFTNVVCGWIFDLCYQKRDSEVIKQDVYKAINIYLHKEAKTSFQHFWLDGILDSSENKDIKSDLRRRTLLAISLGMSVDENFQIQPVNEEEILRNFNPPPTINRNEYKKQLGEFQNRKIVYFQNTGYRIKPKLFEVWLIRYGRDEIVTGIADLEEFIKNQELENKLEIKPNEISKINEKFSFASQSRTDAEFKNWLNQFGKNSNQRIIFKLLELTKFFTEEELKKRIRDNYSNIFKGILQEIKPGRLKRDDTLLTYFNFGAEDNEVFAQKTSEVLSVLKENIFTINNLNRQIDDTIKLILIVHPFLYNESDILKELFDLWEACGSMFENNKIKIKWLNLYAYPEILSDIRQKIPYNMNMLEIITLFNLDPRECELFDLVGNVLDKEFRKEAQKLITEYFPSFPLQHCHNFVFEFSTPQFSLPFFWYPKLGFHPLYEKARKVYIYANKEEIVSNLQAKKIGDELELKMLNVLITTLRNNLYDDWWVKAVPEKIRKKCMLRWDDEKRKGKEYNYLDFIDYAEIAKQNDCLRPYFFYDDAKTDPMQISKDKGTNWLSRLNEFRKIYSHPTREEIISLLDFNYLKKMQEWFINNLEKRKENDN